MDIVKYLDAHGILWLPIHLYVGADGKKIHKLPAPFANEDGWAMFTNFKGVTSKDDLIEIQKHSGGCNSIAIDTRHTHQVDCDDPEEDMKHMTDDHPYFNSFTKKLPHIFYNTKRPQPNNIHHPFKNQKLECLHGQWSYASRDTLVMNADKDIMEMNNYQMAFEYSAEYEVDMTEDAVPEVPKAPVAPRKTTGFGHYQPELDHRRAPQLLSTEDMQALIRKHAPQHNRSKVTTFVESQGIYKVTGKWCAIAKRIHNSNGQYFFMNGTQLVQKCCDPECKGETKYKTVEDVAPVAPVQDLASCNLITDDNHGADIIIARYGNILKKTGKFGNRIFIFSGNIWSEEYTQPLRALILKSKLTRMGMSGPVPYAGNTSGANALMSAVISKLENEPLFYEELWHNNLGKIYYKNGYYDFDDAKFYESVLPEHSFTTFRISFDFPEFNQASEDIVLSHVLMPIFNDREVLDNNMALMSRGLAGRLEDKQWLATRGFRNCGKGVYSDAYTYAFPGYVDTFNADSLMVNKNSQTQDVAKSLSAYKKFEWVRLGISHEILNDGRLINGNTIKGKLASGGDMFELRTNHKDEIQIRLQTLFSLNFNDCPKFNSPDCLQTLNMFVLKSIFSDTPTGIMKQADTQMKEKLRTKDYIAGFTHLILKAYTKNKVKKCEMVKDWTEELMENNGKEDNIVKEHFTITTVDEDIVLNPALKIWMRNNRVEMSMDKLGDYLEQMGAVKDKHLGGAPGKQGNLRGFRGVKMNVVNSPVIE